MPIYEYQCAACGTLTDVKHGFKETNREVCPACGGALVRRFTPAGIVFKGSGFYVNDSRKAAADRAAKSGAAAKSDGAAGETGKTDSGAKSEAASQSDGGSKADPAAKSGSESKGSSKGDARASEGGAAKPKSDAAA